MSRDFFEEKVKNAQNAEETNNFLKKLKKTRRRGGDTRRKFIAIGVDCKINGLAQQIERLIIGVDELFATKSGVILASIGLEPRADLETYSLPSPKGGNRVPTSDPFCWTEAAAAVSNVGITTVAIIGTCGKWKPTR